MVATIVRKPKQVGKKRLGQALCEQFYGLVEAHGPDMAQDELRKLVHHMRAKGQIRDADLSLRAIAEGILGENWQQKVLRHGAAAGRGVFESQLAIDVSAFSNITGQLFVDRIITAYNNPEFIGDKLMTTIPVTNGNLGSHKEPWLSRVLDEPSAIMPGGNYPMTSFKEQYLTLPAVGKYGEQLAITMEAIYSDLTRQMFSAADDVGRKTRQFKERWQLVTICGLNVVKYGNGNTFNYMGTGYNTYLTSGLYTNAISGATITDYTGIQAMQLLFAKMTDLASGDPLDIPLQPKHLCVPDKEMDLRKVWQGQSVLTGAWATSGATNVVTDSPNPLQGAYDIIPSVYLYHLLTDAAPNGLGYADAKAKEYVWRGAFEEAFVWREVEPFYTYQMPPGNEAEFAQDIMYRVKTRIWGAPGVAQENR